MTITQLYAEFENALAAVYALRPLQSKEKEEEHKEAFAAATELSWRIVKALANPTNPIPEMQLKIAVAGWGLGVDQIPALAEWTAEQTNDQSITASCLVSIREDLRAMQARHN
jgi:hypothetical protein